MATTKTFIPITAVHPTELIKDEMRERGLKRSELAERMGIQLSNLSRLLNKKENITQQTAMRLENALGIDAEMWLNLQAQYDKDIRAISFRDEQEKEYASIENVLSNVINLSALFRNLALNTYTFAQDRIKELFSIFHISNSDALLQFAAPVGRFKKSEKIASDDKNMKTWVLLAYKQCLLDEVSCDFVPENADLAATEIAMHANIGDISEQMISDILHENGIGYSFVQKLEKAPIDAYSTMIGNTPYVITSHRHNNMDMLVFDVLHELKHVMTDLKDGYSNLSYNGDASVKDEKEKEADKYAEDKLIPPSVWQDILKSKSKNLNPYNVFHTVVTNAVSHGISPTIAAWRYKHDTGVYGHKGYQSTKIR